MRSNLLHGRPEATDDEIWEALAVAQARDFVAELPEGLDAPVAQGGTNFSGGQRQRLAIARAVVRRPGIYLFDDAFSALDLATDARLRAALRPITRDASVLVVAQRVSTIIDADLIVVLEDGRVVGRGTHEELLADLRDLPGDRLVPAVRGGGGMSTSSRPRRRPAKQAGFKATERIEGQGPGPGRGPMGGGMVGQKAMDFGPSAKRLLARMRPDRGPAVLVVLLGVVSVALMSTGPRILGHATDLVFAGLFSSKIPAGSTQAQAVEALRARGDGNLADMLAAMDHVVPGQGVDFDAVGQVLLLALAVYVVASLLAWLQGYVLNGVVQNTVRRMRQDVEEKIHRLPLAYFDRSPRGEMLSRVTNDIDNISQTLQQTMSQLLTSLMTVVAVLAMMFWISPMLALIALVSVPVSLLVTRAIMQRSQGQFIAQWRRTGQLNAHIEESFSGHALVKAYNRQDEVEQTFAEENDELFQVSFGAQFVSGLIMPAMMFIGNLNYVVVAVVGGLRVASGSLSLGDVQAFVQYTRQFTQPLTTVASMMNLLQSGVASAERVFELLDADEEPADAADLASPAVRRGEVRLRARVVLVRRGPAADRGPLAGRAPGADGGDRRADRRRQDHPGQPGDAVLRAGRRPDHHRRRRHHVDAARDPARPGRHGAPGHLAVRGHHPRQHRLRPTGRDRGRDPRGRAGDVRGPLRALAARRLRHGGRRGGRRTCPRGSGSWSPSPGRSSPTRRC